MFHCPAAETANAGTLQFVLLRRSSARRRPASVLAAVYGWFVVYNPISGSLYHFEAHMAQAIVDPAELRRFAQNLKRFNNEVHTNLAALHGQLLALGDTWRDQEHALFLQEFEQTVAVLEKFLETADQHIPFLLRKAE